MYWDEVEREFFILGAQMHKVSESFQALAVALKREREKARLPNTRSHAAIEKTKGSGSGRPVAARIFD